MVVAKGKRFTFLLKFVPEIFYKCTKTKIIDINENFMGESTFQTNDLVYNIGHPSQIFYIVSEGRLVLETIVEQETNMKFPIENNGWEVKRKTKTMQYHIIDLKKGDYFGHEEILTGKQKR